MIIQLKPNISKRHLQAIKNRLEAIQYKLNKVETQFGQYIIAVGNKDFDIRSIGAMEGIKDIHRVSDDYKLVSKKWKVNDTKIDLGDGIEIGTGNFHMMAGPCSIESEEQIESTIQHLLANNIKIMRGGVYKPRPSPYSFRGLGQDGLKFWYEKAKAAGTKIITEVMMTE